LAFVIAFSIFTPENTYAQKEPAFPQKNGVELCYRHYDGDGIHDADCTLELRNVTGNSENGSVDIIYKCVDSKGNAYFDGPNEFVMQVLRQDSQTYITMDKMGKTLKVMNLITAGDVSSIYVPMTVGETLPDTMIYSTLGIFKATLTISEKKVLDHKTINVNGQDFECWLVHEKIFTKTPFSTDTATSDTWYAKGAGCVSQTVYDSKGKLKGKMELLNVKR